MTMPPHKHYLVVAAVYDPASKRCTSLCIEVAAENEEHAALLADTAVRESFTRDLGLFEPVSPGGDLFTEAELPVNHGYEYSIRVIDHHPDIIV